jgi:hypothetical protein
MDFHAKPCYKSDGRIKNLVGENGYRLEYKSTSKA